MDALAKLMEDLAATEGVAVVNTDASWKLRMPRPTGFETEIEVAREVLEWFVSVQTLGGPEVWSDWIDYSGYDNRSREELTVEMAQDIRAFVESLRRAEDFRVRNVESTGLLASKRGELFQDGAWRPVWRAV